MASGQELMGMISEWKILDTEREENERLKNKQKAKQNQELR